MTAPKKMTAANRVTRPVPAQLSDSENRYLNRVSSLRVAWVKLAPVLAAIRQHRAAVSGFLDDADAELLFAAMGADGEKFRAALLALVQPYNLDRDLPVYELAADAALLIQRANDVSFPLDERFPVPA
jgi:hypothetical protein